MLALFRDPDLRLPIDADRPAWFLMPEAGGERSMPLYVGMRPRTLVWPVNASAGTIEVDDAFDLPNSGSIQVADLHVTYTNKTGNLLYGIPSAGAGAITKSLSSGTRVLPTASPSGANLQIQTLLLEPDVPVSVRLKAGGAADSAYGIAGASLLLSVSKMHPHLNLLHGFRFQEAVGSKVADYGPSPFSAVMTGSAVRTQAGVQTQSGAWNLQSGSIWTPGVSGSALTAFYGSGAVECWFQTATSGAILQFPSGVKAELDTSRVLNVSVPVSGTSTVSISDLAACPSTWNHLVLTWSNQFEVWLNGRLVGSQALANVPAVSGALSLGGRTGDIGYDELRTYSRRLYREEIAARWNQGNGAGLADYGLATVEFWARVTAVPGSPTDWQWTFSTNPFTLPGNTTLAAQGPARAQRRDQALSNEFRTYPGSYSSDEIPGFVLGEHRWRDRLERNAAEVLATRWDISPDVVGREKFTAGAGFAGDLQVVSLERPSGSPNSICPRLQAGSYFTGPDQYYLPSDPVVEILPVSPGTNTLLLAHTPGAQTPVFAGRFRSDEQGHYDAELRFRRVLSFDADDPNPQFILDRKNKQLVLNPGPNPGTLYLGIANGATTQVIDSPLFPLWSIRKIYAESPYREIPFQSDLGSSPSYTYDRNTGVFTFHLDSQFIGQPLFADYDPAVAVIYDKANWKDAANGQLITDVDLNPAFAGIAQGYLYIQHRPQRVRSIELFADKQRIALPDEYANYTGAVAFGPVYNQNDYALLLAVAYGATTSERIVGKRLQAVVEPGWLGTLNYQDPMSAVVGTTTGGDGSSTLVYLPPSGYGLYLDAALAVSGATVTLPQPIPFDELWNSVDGWRVNFYSVKNDHPYLGKVGARISQGEIPFVTTGVPGTANYRTNGQRLRWNAAGAPVRPINAKDAGGNNALISGVLNPSFTGTATKIVYSAPPPSGANIPAYFISYPGRIALRVVDPETGVSSNYIVLQLSDPPPLVESYEPAPYLRLADQWTGRLNTNRLGGGPIPAQAFFSRRY